ncbi:MAG: UDP-N-acetylmuramoyl-tripeptide--D-alanyl-D-alanine ligase [Myxococcota bacterium]
MTFLSRRLLDISLTGRSPQFGSRVGHAPRGISTDSRDDVEGKWFVSLIGDRFDAHQFIDSALSRGAAAVIAQMGRSSHHDDRIVWVDDTLRALQDLAAAHLQQTAATRIGLTGSNGKTTTKELLAKALGSAFSEELILATQGNLNNHIGLPLTALRLGPQHRVAVFEMGMNHLGEIARLCEIARPQVGIITNIGTAHAGNVGGIEGVARAKGEIFAGLDRGGVAIVNLDDPRCRIQADLHWRGRRITFGRDPEAMVRLEASDDSPDGGLSLKISYQGDLLPCRVALEGAHNALNVTGAVAGALALDVPFDSALRGVETMQPIAGRLVRRTLPGGQVLIDDTYNANPDSMRAALLTTRRLVGPSDFAVALGEMRELGDDAEREHESIGRSAAVEGARWAAFCGPFAEAYARGARQAGLAAESVILAKDSEALAEMLAGRTLDVTALLVKGSRGARMETVVQRLMREVD